MQQTPRTWRLKRLVNRARDLVVAPVTKVTGKNALSGQWIPAGDMKQARWEHTMTLLGDGTVMVTGGRRDVGDEAIASVEIYTWSALGGTWASGPSMANAREGHTATRLNDGNVLVIGGGGGKVIDKTGQVYLNLFGYWTWQPIVPMQYPRYRHTATPLENGTVLVVAGFNDVPIDEVDALFHNTAELYDPVKGIWISSGGRLNRRRAEHTATRLLSGKILVVGGSDDFTFGTTNSMISTSTAELYDPLETKDPWSFDGEMKTPRAMHTATLLTKGKHKGKVLVAGGDTNGTNAAGQLTGEIQTATSELYDPATHSWVPVPEMNFARSDHVATELPDGRVLVAGGTDVDLAEIFDPEANTWTLTGAMGMSASGFIAGAATLLHNGALLIAGGVGGEGQIDLSKATLYSL